jgi:exodeoxyribonuclease VII small subunit
MAITPKNVPNIDSANAETLSFENALSELEDIVITMEAGQMPLQEALDAYKRGIVLLRQCQDTLSTAEQQIRILNANELHNVQPETGSGQEG